MLGQVDVLEIPAPGISHVESRNRVTGSCPVLGSPGKGELAGASLEPRVPPRDRGTPEDACAPAARGSQPPSTGGQQRPCMSDHSRGRCGREEKQATPQGTQMSWCRQALHSA